MPRFQVPLGLMYDLKLIPKTPSNLSLKLYTLFVCRPRNRNIRGGLSGRNALSQSGLLQDRLKYILRGIYSLVGTGQEWGVRGQQNESLDVNEMVRVGFRANRENAATLETTDPSQTTTWQRTLRVTGFKWFADIINRFVYNLTIINKWLRINVSYIKSIVVKVCDYQFWNFGKQWLLNWLFFRFLTSDLYLFNWCIRRGNWNLCLTSGIILHYADC